MSKTLPMFSLAAGGAALVLGIAYGVTTRGYRDAEITTFERKIAMIEASRQAAEATASREAELSERLADLEATLATVTERADDAEAAAAEALARAEEAEATLASMEVEAPAEAPEEPETLVTAGAFGDPGRGADIFKQCAACHSVGQGAKDRVGPHLNGIFGRRAGAHDGYKYSDDMAMMGSDGLTWTLETLNAYMENPKALVSRTRMNFDGLADAGERADVLAYLRQFSDDPSNIPEAAPTAVATDRAVAPEILAIQGDPEHGEYLSSECQTCHQRSGEDDGIPSITLWPEEDFVIAMHAYKEKLRPHPVMQMLAGRLNNEEIASLAAYFATLEE